MIVKSNRYINMQCRYPIMDGQVGFQKIDPDGEDNGGRTDSNIRQSDVRWL